ncbi:hypothetical protein [Sphingomonas psychrolutea]|uniref:Uncharacterized protein n=1 Tax=Sphingomonas psychrolutea TaxID=1259676 RepID=A0ABQ1GE48_9SPHN|nr:hypothetical protein [Sphingomonas psychrolutea]GGA41852.1 hypothetical protein GCM10011395_10200 [Sphingomonas psychrolutea]
MTFFQALRRTYGGSIAFLIACPLLALVPVFFEVVQHIVEVKIGMYQSIAMAKAVEHDPWRMGFGMIKVIALILPGYWIVRFLAWRDPRAAARPDARAVRLFAGFAAFQIALAVLQLFVLPQIGWVLLATFVGGQVIGILIAAWGVAAALGNAAIGPRASVAIMARQIPWTFVFSLVAMLPLMVPHYAFAALAILGPKALLWTVLLIDSLLVGWLSAVLVAASYVAAERAAGRAGVSLRG